MKRFHIHIGVDSLDEAIRFYSSLFGAVPVKTKPDYAKWMLDDPCVNFAISTRANKKGVDHLGIQVEEESELNELRSRLERADMTVLEEGATTCCYARSDKSWVQDPAGIPWETYRTMEDAHLFSESAGDTDGACCVPDMPAQLISLKSSSSKGGR
ncbi:ArsI/CadI family heavy metal resistance metalloenzyme [Nitrospira lenta]|uniref:Glyoxalase family protein n=1 Tax=Nitrospira lenta TaxID=1436998 RepID=A0A330L4N5_9BACT|nr:ArsI/CadI family heavy metal resistance metalloenzyme [Nitrospira lenta]SPP64647.1 Glyoxalase family protein [Nitrospira lenta]